MRDQASELRNLVARSVRVKAIESGPAQRLIAIGGGKRGVGSTELALNIAVALSEQGTRAVLVDADLGSGTIAARCALADSGNVVDVMHARCDIHEVFQRGPGGILVVPGLVEPRHVSGIGGRELQRLCNQFRTLGRHAEAVILDIGCGASDVGGFFWRAADARLLVTTTEAVAVMDTYAMIKSFVRDLDSPKVCVVVNRAEQTALATDVIRRIDQSCRRFLQLSVVSCPPVPPDPSLFEAPHACPPCVLSAPKSAAAAAVHAIARQLLDCDPSSAAARRTAVA